MKEWWIRTGLVLQAPRAVFSALRDDSAEAAAQRAEPVLLVVLVAGIALTAHASTDFSGSELYAYVFLIGAVTGAVLYWFYGAILFGTARWLGSQGSYRRARHVLAFACVPLALSLAVAPAGQDAFKWATVVLSAWSVALLVIGVRAVHGWSWGRAAAAAAVPVVVAALPVAFS